MGDRTAVTLSVMAKHFDKLNQVLLDFGGAQGAITKEDGDFFNYLFSIEFEEVNYGDLGFLKELEEAGVPFTSRWEDGGDFNKGETTLRFTSKGLPVVLEVYDEQLNFSMPMLMDFINKSDLTPAEKYAAIEKAALEHQATTIPLPWDNQAEYAETYLAMKLIQAV